MIYHILLVVGLPIGVIAQLLLKKGMGRYDNFKAKNLPLLIKNETVILGLTLYGASLSLWLLILANLELSYAYPFASLNYFFIALFSKKIFKENVSTKRWLSIFVIFLGVAVVSIS